MTTAAEHVGSIAIVAVGQGYTQPRAECTCGWTGTPRERPTQCHIDLAAHVDDVGIRPKESV